MRQRLQRAGLLAAVVAALAGVAIPAAPARADFVDALGSPFPTAAPTRALDVADADGDGTLDVASGGLSLRQGHGTGRLGGPLTVGTPGPVLALDGGDLDGDGRRDYAAIAPGAPRRLLTYTRLPSGAYAQGVALADAGPATAVAIADLNGDGRADLAVARGGGGDDVTALLADGGGGWAAASYSSGLSAVADLLPADLNGDGRPELVAAGGAAELAVLANDGAGAFAAGAAVATGAAGTVERIAPLDFDGDGRVDVAGTDSGGGAAVVLLRGDGAGGLAALGRRGAGLPAPPSAVAAGDMNGDGRADVVAGSGGAAVAVLHGDGAGGLAPAPGSPFGAGVGNPSAIAAADMNRNGQLDLVVAGLGGAVAVRLSSDTGRLEPLPRLVDFGALPAGTLGQTATLGFRSARGRVTITRADLYGSSRFAVTGGDCVGRTLLLGQTCSLTVAFTPPKGAGGERSLLSLDATAAAVVVPLEGEVRPPVLDGATVRPRRVLAGRRLVVRHSLSEAARVRVLVERGLPGRRIGRGRGRRCVEVNRRNRKRKRCRAWERVARSSRPGVAGDNAFRLRARGRGRGRSGRLEPGLYRVSLSAADRFRNRSDEATAAFRVRERKPRRSQAARRSAK